MADFDAAAGALAIVRDFGPARLVVGLVGRGIGRADLVEEPLQPFCVAILKARLGPIEFLERRVVENFAFASRRKDDEFVAEVAADRA